MSLLGDLNISGTATGRIVSSTPITQTLRVGEQRLFAASANSGYATYNSDLDKLEWRIVDSCIDFDSAGGYGHPSFTRFREDKV